MSTEVVHFAEKIDKLKKSIFSIFFFEPVSMILFYKTTKQFITS